MKFSKLIVFAAKFVRPLPEIDAILNRGIDANEKHPVNILLISVTLLVINRGTEINEKHPLNILFILVTLLVLNRGTDFSETHP